MTIQKNVSLAQYCTMRLGGIADYLIEINDRAELSEAVAWAQQQNLPIIMIGTGSNIVWRDEGFHGVIFVNKIMGYEIIGEDETGQYLTIGAGEPWDSAVLRSVKAGLTGIEALSIIPGTAGATPVQNVGAYGQDISQTLTSVEAFDLKTGQLTNIPAEACEFGYRTSTFKTINRRRLLITAITLHLQKGNPMPPYYGSVQQKLDEQGIKEPTPAIIRQIVIDIRNAKLPDVAKVANSGSFFANPIVDGAKLADLLEEHPGIPYWPTDNGGAKIPAAWLLEQAGFKDYHDTQTGMSTWHSQPLVLVNEHAQKTADLLAFNYQIIEAIEKKFGITLQQELHILPEEQLLAQTA